MPVLLQPRRSQESRFWPPFSTQQTNKTILIIIDRNHHPKGKNHNKFPAVPPAQHPSILGWIRQESWPRLFWCARARVQVQVIQGASRVEVTEELQFEEFQSARPSECDFGRFEATLGERFYSLPPHRHRHRRHYHSTSLAQHPIWT